MANTTKNNNKKNVETKKANEAKVKTAKLEYQTIKSAKIYEFATKRKNVIIAKANEAQQFTTNKLSTNVIINRIATAGKYKNNCNIETLCKSYISFIKDNLQLPKQIIGLLKKQGCNTIKKHITNETAFCYIDKNGNIKESALVNIVCKYNKDIANIIKNLRNEARATQTTKK